jgi:phosphoribosyl 1,2-cyclic phosphate phosphodiesterase
MKLTFLGTGTSQGIPVLTCKCDVCLSNDYRDRRFRTSALISTNSTTLVIDAGPDFRTQMLQADVRKLDAVFLTHAHHDHVSGMDDVRAYNFAQKKPVPVYGNRECLSHISRYYDYAFEEDKYPGVPEFELKELDQQAVIIGDIQILPVPVLHGKLPILGYRIGNVAYVTDASFIPESSILLLEGVKILVVNALRQKEHHSHFNIQQALEMIYKIHPVRAYLTHLSHMAGRHEDIAASLPDNVSPAYDGLSIEV